MEFDGFKISHVAKNLIALKMDSAMIETKEDFLAYLIDSIKTIEINIESFSKDPSREAGHRYPPKEHHPEENDEILLQNAIEFSKLKEKIELWKNESIHFKPFYSRSFVKQILSGGANIQYAERLEAELKIRTVDFDLDDKNKFKEFLLSWIELDDEKTGMKFKEHQQTAIPENDNMPVDIYNAALIHKNTGETLRVYIKFYVRSIDTCCFDLELALVSFHPDENQKGVE